MQRILNLLITNSSVDYAAVVAPDGLIYSEYKRENSSHLEHHGSRVMPVIGEEINDEHIEVVASVVDRGNIIASVFIRSNLDIVVSQQLVYQKLRYMS